MDPNFLMGDQSEGQAAYGYAGFNGCAQGASTLAANSNAKWSRAQSPPPSQYKNRSYPIMLLNASRLPMVRTSVCIE